MSNYFLSRLQNLDRLIRIKATGTPQQLADKLSISERTLYETLELMKDLGAPIKYCRHSQRYYYTDEGGFDFSFRKN